MGNNSRQGFVWDKDLKKSIPGVLEYNDPDHEKEVFAFGTTIAVDVARKLINNYWDELDPNDEKDREKGIAFTFGKDALLSILSQQGCEAVRFYLAKRTKSDIHGSVKEGQTLVAIGSNSENFDIGIMPKDTCNGNVIEIDHIVKDMKPNKPLETINTPKVDAEGVIIEMVPPIPLGDFLKGTKFINSRYESLAVIIRNYFNSK